MRNRILAGVTASVVTVAAGLAISAEPAAALTLKPLIYVTGSGPGRLTVLDADTGQNVNDIDAGHGSGEVVLVPDAGYAFAADESFDTLDAVLLGNSRVEREIPVGHSPHGVAVDASREHIYVANWGSNTVTVIRGEDFSVGATIAVGTNPHGVAVSPDSRRAYVTTADGLQVIDAATGSVTATVPVGMRPYGVAITPDGRRAFVTNWGADTVSVVDTATNAVTATITVGAEPYDVAITPDGTRAYVTAQATGTVAVIDTATNAVAKTVTVAAHPYGIDIPPDGKHAYVTAFGSGGVVTPIDTATNTAGANIPVGNNGPGIAAGTYDATAPQPTVTFNSLSVGADHVDFDTSATMPGLARVVSYQLNFGDGTPTVTQTSPYFRHAYAHGGHYIVTVFAVDAFGQTGYSVPHGLDVQPWVGVMSLLSLSNLRFVAAEAGGSQPLVANRTSIGEWERFDVIDLGGGDVALRSHANNLYLGYGAGNTLIAGTNGRVPFRIVPGANGTFALQDKASGRYVSSNNGAGPLTADRTSIGPWELFANATTAGVSITAGVNGRIVTAENGGGAPLVANRTAVGTWETFDVVDAGDGWVALFSHANYRFVTAENQGGSPLIANRAAVGNWERFKVVRNPDGTQSLLANANGRYVTAENGGAQPLIANRPAVGPWEQFTGLR